MTNVMSGNSIALSGLNLNIQKNQHAPDDARGYLVRPPLGSSHTTLKGSHIIACDIVVGREEREIIQALCLLWKTPASRFPHCSG